MRLGLLGFVFCGGCCHFAGARDTAPLRALPNEVGIVALKTEDDICSGAIIRAQRAGEGWEHLVLTARHCFGPWRGEVPSALVFARVDAGHEGFVARVAGWGTDRLEGASIVPVIGFKTVLWFDDDWAVLKLTSPMRLGVLPLATTAETRALHEGDRVTLPSYLDTKTTENLAPHEHPFSWGAVPPELPQDGHSGAPVVKDGKIVAVFVRSETNSIFCRRLNGCMYHSLGFVSVAKIREVAHQHGLVLD